MGILRRIVGYVDLDGSGFEKGAIKVENTAKHLGKEVGHELERLGTGLVAGFGIAELGKSIVETIANAHRLSEEFRVNTDEVQKWEVAARRVNMSAEDVGNALNKLKKARAAAVGGDKGSTEAFGQFGVQMETLRDASKETKEILDDMMNHVAGREIIDSEDVAGMELFGKSGAKILSIFQQLKELGPINLISKEDIENVTRAERTLEGVKRDATVGAASGVGWLSRMAQKAAYEWAYLKGEITETQMQAHKAEVDHPSAHDDKKMHSEREAHYATTKVVDLHKDDLAIERERLELQEKINRNNLASLTNAQKMSELKKEIAEDEDKAVRALYEGNDLESEKYAKRAEDRRGELIALQNKRGKDLANDSLNRIGVFVGGQEQVMAMVQRQHLDVARKTQMVATQILNEMKNSPKDKGGIIE